jgi:hypothetical protein
MGSQGPSAMVALTLAWLGKVLYGYTAARIDFCNETQRLFSSIAVWSYREDALPCRFQRSWWCSQPFEKVGPKTFTRESSFRRIGWFDSDSRSTRFSNDRVSKTSCPVAPSCEGYANKCQRNQEAREDTLTRGLEGRSDTHAGKGRLL